MKRVILLIVLAAAVLLLNASAYTVFETEQIIITQFGEPKGETISEPGLHFKLPFIQKVNRFDNRWLEWDGEAAEMPTKEKTFIWVDTYARWRISDALQFFKRVKDERGAQSRLDDIIDGETRNVIASHELKEVVRRTKRGLVRIGSRSTGLEETEETEDVLHEEIVNGREKLTSLILGKAQSAMPEYGIELVDVQFQRVNYTKTVEEKVYKRMISERNRIAELYRSEGQGESARISGEMDRELKQIESDAYRQVQQIQGDADAQAVAIYADAHNQDPGLYRLLKSLESYASTLDSDSVVVLSTEGDYFKQLTHMNR